MSAIAAGTSNETRASEVLTPEAIAFVAELERRFRSARDELLQRRLARRQEIRATGRLGSLPETAHLREDQTWRVAPLPADLRDRRVEITGPTERKMAINALNSGAKVWLADLEDANTPTWDNMVSGQVNLCDVVRRTIAYDAPDGKEYRLTGADPATLVVRPRGWHLDERHLIVDGSPTVAALTDFGLFMFHNATELLRRGSGPYLYLPKLESHLEARLWANVFRHAEESLGIPAGSVRATVLIETITAGFEMEEILYELREYAAGLNAGRWDYLFSLIKVFRDGGASFVLPDRNEITMAAPFMRAYTERLVRTCHARGALAIGGMAAFIPNRRDREVTERALAKVRSDKQREAADGFDGSWVAHPDLVPVCRDVFDAVLGDSPNQIDRLRVDVVPDDAKMLAVAGTGGEITAAGVRNNVAVALRYLTAWLGGSGAVAIFGLMEDVATAEIARSQIWQWLHAGVVTKEGQAVTRAYVLAIVNDEAAAISGELAEDRDAGRRIAAAVDLFEQLALGDEFIEFLTIPAGAFLE